METNAVHRFIVKALKNTPGYAAHLPGGVHKAVAPNGAGYPHLVFQHATGLDVNSFGGFVGSGMQYLVKVIDASESEATAVASFAWAESALLSASGTAILDTGETVWLDRLSPINLPVFEDDETFQQIGRMFTVFVDMP